MDNHTWHALEIAEAVKLLQARPERGLTEEEARERLALHGRNELMAEERESGWGILWRQFKSPLLVILLAAAIFSGAIGERVDAIVILLIVLFCAVLGFVQEYRASRALDALKSMLAPTCSVLREGKVIVLDARELAPGDVLVVESGDMVAADARLIENHGLKCDEASLTGESASVSKTVETLPSYLQLPERKNMVFAGSRVAYGRGRAVVVATGLGTAFGKIAREVAAAAPEKTPLEKRAQEIGAKLGIIALAVCFGVAGIGVLREYLVGGLDWEFAISMLMFAVSLAVAAVPEALAAVVTGSLAIGMRQMAKRNVLIRKMPAVETLGSASVVCTDKTGTLTKGEMTARRIYLWGEEYEVTGAGYEPVGELRANGVALDPDALSEDLKRLLLAGVLCNNSEAREQEGRWTVLGDPTEAALLVLARKAGQAPDEQRAGRPRLEEFPFSSERKRMGVVCAEPEGRRRVFVKGALESTLNLAPRLLDHGSARPIRELDRNEILRVAESLARRGLRVLAFYDGDADDVESYEPESTERGLTFLGLVGLMDPPRPEAAEAVAACARMGARVVMITGDHKLTAMAVARELGIYREGDLVLGGEELAGMDEKALARVVDRVSVYARVAPLDKLTIVKAWKRRGEIVAMTGDGVNDAAALRHADIGAAMGITGCEAAKEAADMVLLDDNFASIVAAMEQGRWIYDNIKKYLAYLLRSNLVEVAVVGTAALWMGPESLPLAPAAILYVNLATDGLPALALGASPPEADLKTRPPRNPKESVFTKDLKLFALFGLLVEAPLLLWFFFHYARNELTHGRTVLFLSLVAVELFLAFSFRSLRASVFTAPPHRWLSLAVVWELALAAGLLCLTPVRSAFGIGTPAWGDIGAALGAAGLVFLSMELAKALLRRFSPQS
jgi:Ca2+-transporting ATPase